MHEFRTPLGHAIFQARYTLTREESWSQRAKIVVRDVCGKRQGGNSIEAHPLMSSSELRDLEYFISRFMFIPAGRYLWYAGRGISLYTNCFLFKAEADTREEWGRLMKAISDSLMSGGGVGCDYSILRPNGSVLNRTGGVACLTADTLVYKEHKGTTRDRAVTIGQLFELQETNPKKFSYTKIRSLDESSGEFYQNQLLGVVHNGEAEVFEVTTESGFVIRATLNHRFMDSSREYRELSEFAPGDKIAVHKVSTDALQSGSPQCVSFDPIKSILPAGFEPVYDLQLRKPNHNFVANGFVSHNSGPIPLMQSINEMGRNIRQGGCRRSALYASLNWQHGDIAEFLSVKDWANTPIPGISGMTFADAKNNSFDYPAPLDGTNISLNYDDAWLTLPDRANHSTFKENLRRACSNGEPGFSFNFGEKQNETLRNACAELCSSDDSDCCNLGSINLANIPDKETLRRVVELGAKFLICGSIRGALPDAKILRVREKNRRIGLGLMGVHEWLLQRRSHYEFTPELHEWMAIYRDESERAANEHCDRFYLSRPVGYRALAPTGTIGLLAGTTSGIEPLFAVAYKRRWIDGDTRRYKLVVDQVASDLISHLGIEDPDSIETALDLAKDPERRIRFQAEMQEGYIDHAIASTINLPPWGSEHNNEGTLESLTKLVSDYAPRLRGLTFYPDGARGGQPLTKVSYSEALGNEDTTFEENSERQCRSGVCGV